LRVGAVSVRETVGAGEVELNDAVEVFRVADEVESAGGDGALEGFE